MTTGLTLLVLMVAPFKIVRDAAVPNLIAYLAIAPVPIAITHAWFLLEVPFSAVTSIDLLSRPGKM